MDGRDQEGSGQQQNGSSPEGEGYMPPAAAAAYERKAKIIGVCIFMAVLLTGAIIFDLGTSAWEPQRRESIFVPTGKGQPQSETSNDYRQDVTSYPPQPESAQEDVGESRPAVVWDPLVLAHPRNAYDLPVYDADAPQSWLRLTAGEVKAIAPRNDKMSDGTVRKNFYARTEFYQPESGGNCFFHQYMGTVATYRVGERVRIQYDTSAKDVCGTSRIVK